MSSLVLREEGRAFFRSSEEFLLRDKSLPPLSLDSVIDMERDLSRADLVDRLSGEDSDSFLRSRDPLWVLSASRAVIDMDNDLSLSRADPLDDDLVVKELVFPDLVELRREVSLDRAALVERGCFMDWDSFLPVALLSLSEPARLDTAVSDFDSSVSRRPLRRVGDDSSRSLFRVLELRSL